MPEYLTAEQVAGVVKYVHGGPPDGTTVAQWVAKARQESSFRVDVVNGDDATGLWQIRRFHAQLTKSYSGYVVPTERDAFGDWLKGAMNNWLAAKAVYSEQGWGAWRASGGEPTPTASDNAAAERPDPSRATSGGAVMQDGVVGDERGVEQTSIGDVARDTFGFALDAPGQISKAVQVLIDAARWISDRDNMTRVAIVIGGSVAALLAVGSLTKPAWEPALSAARKVKP